jgi:hypothetical protein
VQSAEHGGNNGLKAAEDGGSRVGGWQKLMCGHSVQVSVHSASAGRALTSAELVHCQSLQPIVPHVIHCAAIPSFWARTCPQGWRLRIATYTVSVQWRTQLNIPVILSAPVNKLYCTMPHHFRRLVDQLVAVVRPASGE